MRTITTAERDLLRASRLTYHHKAEIQNPSGNWISLSQYTGGLDFFSGASWSESIDDPVASGQIRLLRKVNGVSLAPLVSSSSANSSGPLVDVSRGIRLLTAVKAPGVEPVSGDYKTVFWGKTDDIDWTSSEMVLSVRDLGAWLQVAQIEDSRVYASQPASMQTVIQNIITDNTVFGFPTLYMATDPNWILEEFEQSSGDNVMDAIRSIAQQIGYDIRYWWNSGATGYALTLRPIQRNILAAMTTFGPDEYYAVPTAKISDADIRNAIRGSYFDSNGNFFTETVVDNTSIARYGRRGMKVSEASSSNISTQSEMLTFLNSMLADLKTPQYQMAIRTNFFWPAQLGDYYGLLSNADHHDEQQNLAVSKIEHEIQQGDGFTVLSMSGKPKGGYASHLAKEVRAEIVVRTNPKATIRKAPLEVGEDPTKVSRWTLEATAGISSVTLYYSLGDSGLLEAPSNPFELVIPRGDVDTGNRVLTARAVRSPDGEFAEETVLIDWDRVPSIVSTSSLSPDFDVTNQLQLGWSQHVSVDDDCSGFLVTTSDGVGSVTSSDVVIENLGGGEYWIDTSQFKNFTLDIAQAPGSKGTVTYSPYEGALNDARGVLGKRSVQTLSRAPVSTYVVKNTSPGVRDVVITPDPIGSKVFWRVAGEATWKEAGVTSVASPSVTITRDVSVAPVVIEYYCSINGSSETVRTLRLDKDDLPYFKALELSEPASVSNQITAVIDGMDDDVVMWKIWAKKGSYPLAGADPDERYLRGFGNTSGQGITMYAVTGMWYFIARVYDGKGQVFERRATIDVSGAPPAAAGNLTNFNVTKTAGNNVLTWDHNSVAATGHKVVVTEILDGRRTEIITLSDNRSPTIDAAGTDTTAGKGGFWRQVNDGTISKTFSYEVKLYNGTTLVSTYYDSITANYAADPVGSKPTEAPTQLYLDQTGTSTARASWTNTRTNLAIEMEVHKRAAGNAAWSTYAFVSIAAGTDEHTLSGLTSGDSFRYYLRYRNNAGPGPWSDISQEYTVP